MLRYFEEKAKAEREAQESRTAAAEFEQTKKDKLEQYMQERDG